MTTTQHQWQRDSAMVDHRGLRVLDMEECLARLGSRPIGRVAFREAGGLAVLPVNHVLDGTSVVFRTRWDSRLASTVDGRSAAFEVDDYDPVTGSGWSVLVRGVAECIRDEATGRRLEQLLAVPWPGEVEEAFWVRIRADEISGRQQGHPRAERDCC